ncbi:hypothetical protein SEA_TYPHA_121 [Mycobacterium phage Typha]|uniref:Uncharacterized protein n=1 Tax=Mycobacterium phage Typha TaxID=2517971 RepID=A0A482JDQ8_9CAUD|nr:hypothetical protein KCH40_gp048 [Mycobacterium phage Typha]QBP29776.1 hypothetical protein SEA_TYPHA_121 [Mycobacterium phage Typha]URM86562.1 hypothetical protein PBI_HILLTOPFARM_125 [Mycobacterium phage Hilltopfarm]
MTGTDDAAVRSVITAINNPVPQLLPTVPQFPRPVPAIVDPPIVAVMRALLVREFARRWGAI